MGIIVEIGFDPTVPSPPPSLKHAVHRQWYAVRARSRRQRERANVCREVVELPPITAYAILLARFLNVRLEGTGDHL